MKCQYHYGDERYFSSLILDIKSVNNRIIVNQQPLKIKLKTKGISNNNPTLLPRVQRPQLGELRRNPPPIDSNFDKVCSDKT